MGIKEKKMKELVIFGSMYMLIALGTMLGCWSLSDDQSWTWENFVKIVYGFVIGLLWPIMIGVFLVRKV